MKKSLLKGLPFLALVCASAAGLVTAVGCSDDDAPKATTTTNPEGGTGDSATKADTSTPSTTGTVETNLTYNGTSKGPVICTVWTTANFPGPGDVPIGLGSNETPTWPGTNKVVIKDILPNKAYTLCYIMTGAEHRMGPNSVDPVQTAMALASPDVVPGGTAVSNTTLVDQPPPPSDAGADADGG